MSTKLPLLTVTLFGCVSARPIERTFWVPTAGCPFRSSNQQCQNNTKYGVPTPPGKS